MQNCYSVKKINEGICPPIQNKKEIKMGLRKNRQENEAALSALLERLADRMGIEFEAVELNEEDQPAQEEAENPLRVPQAPCREIDLTSASLLDKLEFVLHNTLDDLISGTIALESANELAALMEVIRTAANMGIATK